MHEKKDSLNAYVCNKLHVTVTVNRDEGTTPMLIQCPDCGGRALSRFGHVDSSLEPSLEWIIPSEEEIKEEAHKVAQQWKGLDFDVILEGLKDYVEQGGLINRKIKQ